MPDGSETLFDGHDFGGSHPPNDSPAERQRANDLDGRTWTRYSISIWSDIRKSQEELELGHPAMFPCELPRRLIRMFMRPEDRIVLDPFAGTGSTLLAAQELGKQGIGLEISEDFATISRKRCQQLTFFDGGAPAAQVIVGDAQHLLHVVPENSVDFVVTSPPYWDILLERRSADYKEQRDYGETEQDLGKLRDYDVFLASLERVFAQVFQALRFGKYCCVVVMDLRKKSRFYPFHSDFADLMIQIGFTFDDLIIWDRRQEYNNLRPLGYPSVFRINKVHEYILIFQKRHQLQIEDSPQ